ncbi:perforin-1-like [Eublepharis macularius]|uniref:Perforin-1-like n=1 Tax=Eublepharis macularius TaxID=481883 RepID=A0AA97K737_EUBMA|nr:perforin-1-like [Eublepharis macularius]
MSYLGMLNQRPLSRTQDPSRAAMSKLHFFLAASFGFLSLFQLTASSSCQVFSSAVCNRHTNFVPGHNLIGEGVDITTLSIKGASVVDTNQWERPNRTCTLCQNPLMDGKLQWLPLAAVDWSARRICHWHMDSSVERSEWDVANTLATEVKNNWKIHLELPEAPQVALAGSQSQMTIQAYKYSQRSMRSPVSVTSEYEFYCGTHRPTCGTKQHGQREGILLRVSSLQLRLSHDPPLLASHFTRDIHNLPKEYHQEEYQHFINIYGTHYISQVHLGARVRHLYSVQNCAAALHGLTVFDLKNCLTLEVSLGHLWIFHGFSAKCLQRWKDHMKGKEEGTFVKRHMEVTGGHEPEKLLFSESLEPKHYLEWMKSAKEHPEVVSYSLRPLHTLLSHGDPRRTVLKKATSDYITKRALTRSCSQQCPYNGYQSSKDHCACMCHANDLHNNMCCARERGKAHLKFNIQRGSDLWGDHFSAADSYIKVLFQGREKQTRVIAGNNDPQWHETLDFGTVTLAHRNTYRLEVWDSDVWHDDLLQAFRGELKAGGTYECIGRLTYGYVEFSYTLECAPTLGGGATCQTYMPLKQPATNSKKY